MFVHRCVGLSLVTVCLLLFQLAATAQTCDPGVAELIGREGQVEIRRSGQTAWQSAAATERLCPGDAIRVLDYSRAALRLPDATVLRLDQNTTLTLPAPPPARETLLNLIEGLIHVITRDPRALRVTTPFANAGIEGTEFLVEVTRVAGRAEDPSTPLLSPGSEERASFALIEGRLRVETPAAADTATITAGQRVTARPGQALVVEQVLRPTDAVQWTLWFPQVRAARVAVAAGAAPTGTEASDPGFLLSRATSRIAVGRVSEAEADLAAVLAADPGNADALALRSVLALTRNARDEARGLADQALARDPRSVTALLARSYVAQADFDLAAARGYIAAAVAAQPGDALARARQAELALAVGELAAAREAAAEAARLDPGLALTQTVLGFANLARVDLRAARQAFGQAITLDPAASLPRLGLGLTLIRGGELAAGRAEIETAVLLSPAGSLTRSYAGKAYFEEKRDRQAATQYALARELDPLDPTPWFYQAMLELTANEPVRALASLDAAAARNDNRAVFRSRLLLDQDLAARSAGRGRIFQDLNFEELALREGWTAVALDRGEFAGHRLLADSYGTLARHEVSRVSELTQSQLLQPLNITPIQPQLGEANLFILDTAGPSGLAFNEFNPLFNRDRLALQASGVAGGNSTRGGDVVAAGVAGRWSFSLGAFHFETDGFRDNNDLEQDVLNAFVQFQATPDTSLLLEVRSTDRDQGDLRLLFDPQFFNDSLRQTEETESVRLGLRHAFSPRSEVLALVTWQDAELTADAPPFFGSTSDIEAWTAELQHLYRAERWSLTSGVRYVDRQDDSAVTIAIFLPEPPFLIEVAEQGRTDQDRLSLYSYGQAEVTPDLSLTLGVSADFPDGETLDRDRLNPKLGLRWQLAEATVLRGGVFRTLEVPRYSRQDVQPTLEPTSVAGFNQFFAGVESEEAWRYGLALDHRLSPELALGLELSRRDVDVPYLDFSGPEPETRVAGNEEQLGRAYAYWTPREDLALSLGYQFENNENAPEFDPLGYFELRTHRIPASVSVFRGRGLGARITATWVSQQGLFRDPMAPPDMTGTFRDSDKFVVVDAGLRYRLPGRYGLVSVEVRNLFDSSFSFQDTDPDNPRILPERLGLAKLTVSF